MEAKKKRLTLDVDAEFRRRLKAAAALKGVSMSRYCHAAIDRELARDEANGAGGIQDRKSDVEQLRELQREIFGDRILPGNSVDFIREAREMRDAQMDKW